MRPGKNDKKLPFFLLIKRICFYLSLWQANAKKLPTNPDDTKSALFYQCF